MGTHVAIRTCRRPRLMRSHLMWGLKVVVDAEAVMSLLWPSSNPQRVSTSHMPSLADDGCCDVHTPPPSRLPFLLG